LHYERRETSQKREQELDTRVKEFELDFLDFKKKSKHEL
jgi:hypothetical protein